MDPADAVLDVTTVFVCATRKNQDGARPQVAMGTFVRYEDGRRVLSFPATIGLTWLAAEAGTALSMIESLFAAESAFFG